MCLFSHFIIKFQRILSVPETRSKSYLPILLVYLYWDPVDLYGLKTVRGSVSKLFALAYC